METQREIKFRRVHFFDEENTKFSHFSYWGVNIDGMIFTSPSSNNYALYHIDKQYIGLKDKNGIEIFEGDILHFTGKIYLGTPGKFKDVDYILPVVYQNNKGFQMYEQGIRHYEIYSHEVEVIGNIHENPELLK